jgi:hypothetical protein
MSLALRRHLDVVAHDLDLATQLRQVLADAFELLREINGGVGGC